MRDREVLVAYFTWSNSSYQIASKIKSKLELDIFHIESVKKYPKSYSAAVMVAVKEKLMKARSKLTGKVKEM